MSMADSLADFGHKIAKLQRLLSGGEMRRVTERVAQKSKPIAAAAVSPNSLSHWGKGGKKGGYRVAARYEMLSDTQAAIRPTVPPLAALLELGSYKAGTTWKAPRRRGSARRRKGTVGTYTRSAVPARHAWTHAANAVKPVVPKLYDAEVQRVLGEVF